MKTRWLPAMFLIASAQAQTLIGIETPQGWLLVPGEPVESVYDDHIIPPAAYPELERAIRQNRTGTFDTQTLTPSFRTQGFGMVVKPPGGTPFRQIYRDAPWLEYYLEGGE